jgi:glucosamine kinase
MATYILAVDGGATKTEAELLLPDGQVLARARSGPCNLYRDAARGIASVEAAWQACFAEAGLDAWESAPDTCLSAGVAGLSAVGAVARFRTAFARFRRIDLSGDGYTALIGAFDGGPGALISIGTGVIGCRLGLDGTFRSASGWGFPIGDRGSGAWLGFALIAAWLEHLDGYPGRDPATPLWAITRQTLGAHQPAILAWLLVALPQDYAALAPAIVDAARQGDRFASSLLDQAAQHVAELARALGPSPAMRLALAGGLAPSLASRITALLGSECLAPEVAPAPLRGAWLIGSGRVAPEMPSPPA